MNRVANLLKRASVITIVATMLLGTNLLLSSESALAQSPCVSLPSGSFDGSSSAIIRNGAPTIATVQRAYALDATVRDVYNYFGVTTTDIQNLCETAVAGTVYGNGNVYVGNKLVATNVRNTTRNYVPGSRPVTYNGLTFYVSPMSASLASNSAQAYVVIRNGHFLFSLLNDCGNIGPG
jgi:hypothetical protein